MEDTTLRDQFRGYYKPKQEETDKIWDEGIITLDTNLLLFFYDVQEATAAEHFEALSKRQERLWIPYQVAEEFHRNTHKQRAKQTEAHQQRISRIGSFKNELGNLPTQSRLKASAAQAEAIKALVAYRDELTAELNAIKDLTSTKNPDTILDRITELFDGCIGTKPTKQKLEALFKDGAKRFSEEVPPGYMDAKNKPGNRKYGDYVLWKQLIEHASAEKKDVIFVTEDGKEDWWMKLHPGIPRPELIQEFREETGQNILITKSAHFYKRLFQETAGDDRQAEVEAALQEMEAVVADARAARELTVESVMRQVALAHPVGGSQAAMAAAQQSLQNGIAQGWQLDDAAIGHALKEAVRVDHAKVVAEIEEIETKAGHLEAFAMTFSPDSPDAEYHRRKAEELRTPICALVDRRVQLETSGLL
ncbi:PIN domain-containing protein [Paenarthrobacter sp. NPDC089989]|uniref:PIN domain-containing protein n=1 Tax=unclassified Paenarthrobacter TaxID=2634190 RepID=UPI00382DD56F